MSMAGAAQSGLSAPEKSTTTCLGLRTPASSQMRPKAALSETWSMTSVSGKGTA